MSIRIYGATSGYIELDAPAVANSASVTLPTTNGVLATTSDIAGMTLITDGTLTGPSIILSNIPQTYRDLRLVIRNYLPSTDGIDFAVRINNDSTANRHGIVGAVSATAQSFGRTYWNPFSGQDNATSQSLLIFEIFDYNNTSTWKIGRCLGIENNATTSTNFNYVSVYGLQYNQISAITSLAMITSTGINFTSGNYFLYGVK